MKIKKQPLILALLLTTLVSHTQEKENNFGIKFSGFVKNDMFFDTRQNVTAREGHFLLWPMAKSPDAENQDINEKLNFNFLAIQSRLKGSITGPDAFGARTSGTIEGAFFGHSNGDVNGFRLRHAFLKLNWTNTELLFGQYWHPMFITGCFPGTVSFNTGTPFQPFSRNPQVRLTQKSGNLSFILAAQSQRDFTSRGPAGITSQYLRNAGIPDMHFQIHYGTKNDDTGQEFLAGAGVGYKTIIPSLMTSRNYKTDEGVSGISALGFLKLKLTSLTFKAEAAYGQNACDYLSLGGFAVKDTINAEQSLVSYTPINVFSVWTDIHTNGSKVQGGIFIGYSTNLGASDQINGPVYGLGTDIASLMRVSPRIIYNSGKVRFAGELEYTSAAYGTLDEMAVPVDTETVANIRLLLAAYYFF